MNKKVVINPESKTLNGLFGDYDTIRELQKDCQDVKVLALIALFMALMKDDIDNIVAAFLQTLTGITFDTTKDLVIYLDNHLDEKDTVNLSVTVISLVMKGKIK